MYAFGQRKTTKNVMQNCREQNDVPIRTALYLFSIYIGFGTVSVERSFSVFIEKKTRRSITLRKEMLKGRK